MNNKSHEILLALGRAAQAVQRARTPDEVYCTVGDEMAGLGYHVLVFTLRTCSSRWRWTRY